VAASADTPLLYILTDDLALQGPRFGCGLGQCGCCSVLADGVEIRSRITPVSKVIGKSLTMLEGLPAHYAMKMRLKKTPELHPTEWSQCFHGLENLVYFLRMDGFSKHSILRVFLNGAPKLFASH
jgi:aerobic-type carbon monoxide dehydrogenase small subunit (CoxS/CutS family)